MALSYAPFGDDGDFRPRPYVPPPAYPKGPETTECNYIVMAFVAGVIVMGIMDSLRGGSR
jgi:hypothetical protein